MCPPLQCAAHVCEKMRYYNHTIIMNPLCPKCTQYIDTTQCTIMNLLFLVAERGCMVCANRIIETFGNVNVQDNIWKETALHFAARRHLVEIVRTLLRCGSSVHIRNANEKTPLYVAAWMGRPFSPETCEIIKMLLDRGAKLEDWKRSDSHLGW